MGWQRHAQLGFGAVHQKMHDFGHAFVPHVSEPGVVGLSCEPSRTVKLSASERRWWPSIGCRRGVKRRPLENLRQGRSCQSFVW